MTTAVSCSSLSSAQACYWLSRSLFWRSISTGGPSALAALHTALKGLLLQQPAQSINFGRSSVPWCAGSTPAALGTPQQSVNAENVSALAASIAAEEDAKYVHFTKGQVQQYNNMLHIQLHLIHFRSKMVWQQQVSQYWRAYKMKHLQHLRLASVVRLTYNDLQWNPPQCF